MATLAIRGHATRGNEVIELLEMLGGSNIHRVDAIRDNCVYFITDDKNKTIGLLKLNQVLPEQFVIYTLEEFLEKFPYKVGDDVIVFGNASTIIKADWDNSINEVVYTINIDISGYMTTKLANQLQPYKEQESMEEQTYLNPKANEEKDEIKENLQEAKSIMEETIKIDIPQGYEFDGVDNQQVIFEKIGYQYPKTYEQCCVVLGTDCENLCLGYAEDLLDKLQSLLICRDAYWKLAGEQMGLCKPWKPDFKDDSDKYFICYVKDEVWKSNIRDCNKVLVFPTAEMRDAFYENFKDLIEQCEELL